MRRSTSCANGKLKSITNMSFSRYIVPGLGDFGDRFYTM